MESFWSWVLAALPWVVLVTLSAVGLAGTLLPGIPGGSLILLGAWVFAIWTWLQGEVWLSWPSLSVITVLAFVGGIGQYFVSGYGAKRFGASGWGVAGAALGFIVGMLTGGPLGALIGTFAGAVLVELVRQRRQLARDAAADAAGIPVGGSGGAEAGELLPALEGDAVEGDGEDADVPAAATDRDTADTTDVTENGPASEPALPVPVEDAPATGLGTQLRHGARAAGRVAADVWEAESPAAGKATLAGFGAILGAAASFVFEFVFGLLMIAALIVGLIV